MLRTHSKHVHPIDVVAPSVETDSILDNIHLGQLAMCLYAWPVALWMVVGQWH